MARVFVSYSRKDLSFVERLATDLKNAGFDIWYDVSGLGGGSRWRVEIEDAIRSSQFVIVVLSPDSIASEWVEREFLFASNLKRKIIPLMYRSCELPLNYLDLNYIDVQAEKYEQKFADILHALDSDQSKIALSSSKVRKRLFKFRYAAIISGAIVIIAVTLWILSEMQIFFPFALGPTPTTTDMPTIPTENYLPSEITDGKGVEMILVSAGVFTMGSNVDNGLAECSKFRTDCQPAWFTDEEPSRVIYVDSFYIDKYEVSNALYRACGDAGVCDPPKESSSLSRPGYYRDPQFNDYPVIYVDWEKANAYCTWRGGYLPKEEQWEKAARGTNGNIYPWGNEFLGSLVNFCDINCDLSTANHETDDGYKDTAPVNAYSQGVSWYGVFNMSGNVYEWVADLYEAYPGGDPNASPYFGQGYRVLRGGSWASSIDLLRTSNRDPSPPRYANYDTGFRCASDATP
jgi:formylglycine-generating enzyme required for sulfatase activity